MTPSAKCDPLDLVPLSDLWELETLALFGICVAGKSARIAWPKVKQFLALRGADPVEDVGALMGPFEFVRWLKLGKELDDALRKVRMGQYARIGRAFAAVADLPSAWDWRHLLKVPGVQLKTAKLVELYRHPGQRCACLDVHVLRAMRGWDVVRKTGLKVPDAAPQDPDVYAVLEAAFLRQADKEGVEPWRLDKRLWYEAVHKKKEIAS